MRRVVLVSCLVFATAFSACVGEAGVEGDAFADAGGENRGAGVGGGGSPGSGTAQAPLTSDGSVEYSEGSEGAYACSAPGTFVKVDPNRTFEGGAHQHDMWGGQTQLTIFEGQITKLAGGGWFEMPGAVVHTGAGRVEFKVSWTEQVPLVAETRTLSWDMPGDTRSTGSMYSHTFSTKGSNHSFEVNISNNDPPHASRSTWSFKLDKAPAYVTWIIHRGYDCLPVDPPHYDLWQGATEKFLGELRTKYDGALVCQQSACVMSPGHYGAGLVGENTTVPPGTSRVVVTLSWTNSKPWPGKLALEYTTASTIGSSTTATWKRPLNPAETSSTVRTYELATAPEDWDSPYRTKSLWYFDWYFDNGSQSLLLDETGTLTGEIVITATAYRMS